MVALSFFLEVDIHEMKSYKLYINKDNSYFLILNIKC